MRRSSLAVALVAVALLAGACKKHKPPPMTAIGLGTAHGCAQVEHGAATCWGQDEDGQLGDARREARLVPSANAAFAEHVTSFALGDRYTCAKAEDGKVTCVGDTSLREPLAGVRLLAGGRTDVCVVTGGGVRCFGEHALGPTLAAEERVVALAVGDAHACFAVEAPERKVVCTGEDDHGQAAQHAPVLRGVEVVALAAGGHHTCAVAASGDVTCWGANASGQLGDGSFQDARAPVGVMGVGGAAEVRAGAAHTCVRLRSNTVTCWGDNRRHQLADGTLDPSPRPKPVFGLVGAVELAAAGAATCARLTGGFVRCWGDNAKGQLGDGTTVEHDVPMPVKWR